MDLDARKILDAEGWMGVASMLRGLSNAAIRAGNRPHRSGCGGWAIDAVDVNYEDTDCHCDNCGKRIPAAYED